MPKFGEKSVLIGILMAAIFLVVDAVAPVDVGYEILILGFALCLLLVCSALIDGPRDGLICGLTTFVAQNAGTFAKYAIATGVETAAALLLYWLLLTLIYPVAGTIGGYLGGKLATLSRRRGTVERGTKTKAA
jgi:hypothetical protein